MDNFNCLSRWHNALTFTEKAQIIKQYNFALDFNAIAISESRLFDWNTISPFDEPSVFMQRLAVDGLDLDDFKKLLVADYGHFFSSGQTCIPTPHWVSDIEAAIKKNALLTTQFGGSSFGFLNLITPLIVQGQENLRRTLEEEILLQSDSTLTASAVVQFFSPKLYRILWERISRVVVLEMHSAKIRGQLVGSSSSERFQCFVNNLQHRSNEILNDYPVLARYAWVTISNWTSEVMAFCRAFLNDKQKLEQAFNRGDSLGRLQGVRDSGSDLHQHGKSVLLLTFESGRSIVYKPRSLAVERHFQDFLSWVNVDLEPATFPVMKVIDCGTHGWTEFISFRECSFSKEVDLFYERIGGYLAIFYLFKSTDIHFENLIASGEYPYIIDLETLLHPNPETLQPSKSGNLRIFNDSVLCSGLLPRWIQGTETGRSIDISGLSAKESEIWPDAIAKWRQVDTDDMSLELGVTAVSRSVRNVPVLKGCSAPSTDNAEAITRGFRNVYKTLMDRRSELLSSRGPLNLFADDEVRVVLRSTQTYQTLIHESFHPELLRDALERDRFLDLMLWKEVPQASFLATIVAAEKAQILEGDVPRFTTVPKSLDLHVHSFQNSEKSSVPIKGFFSTTILECVYPGIKALSPEDMEMQCLFIEGALRRNLAQPIKNMAAASSERSKKSESSEVFSENSILLAVKVLADNIIAQAYLDRNRVNWFGPTLFARRHMAIQPLHWQLYDGLPGVALFLAYAGEILGTKEYTNLSRAAVETFLERLEVYSRYIDSAGAFDGWCGLVYMMIHLGAIWSDQAFINMAEDYTHKALGFENCSKSDIISGHAGSIACFLAVHQVTGSKQSLDAALLFGKRLVTAISHLKTNRNINYIKSGFLDSHFGFAHGFHGIVWALLKLGSVSGQSIFTSSGLELLDLCTYSMTIDDSKKRSAAWCNGEGGVGLAWIDLTRLGYNDIISEQAAQIISRVIREKTQGNHSLCHGEIGTVELLATAYRTLTWPCHSRMLERLGKVIDEIFSEGPSCGTRLSIEHPGLMIGTSGIGWGLLRVVYPERVPSVLLLEAPKVAIR